MKDRKLIQEGTGEKKTRKEKTGRSKWNEKRVGRKWRSENARSLGN
jgi:hypothetical protein